MINPRPKDSFQLRKFRVAIGQIWMHSCCHVGLQSHVLLWVPSRVSLLQICSSHEDPTAKAHPLFLTLACSTFHMPSVQSASSTLQTM
jgi:hypothetical protein